MDDHESFLSEPKFLKFLEGLST